MGKTVGTYQVRNNNLGPSGLASSRRPSWDSFSRVLRDSSRSSLSGSSLRAFANTTNGSVGYSAATTSSTATRTFSKNLIERLVEFRRHCERKE